MFFLDHAWLVPLIPALSFVVILFFGKRFPRQGSEVGIVAVGASGLCGRSTRDATTMAKNPQTRLPNVNSVGRTAIVRIFFIG